MSDRPIDSAQFQLTPNLTARAIYPVLTKYLVTITGLKKKVIPQAYVGRKVISYAFQKMALGGNKWYGLFTTGKRASGT